MLNVSAFHKHQTFLIDIIGFLEHFVDALFLIFNIIYLISCLSYDACHLFFSSYLKVSLICYLLNIIALCHLYLSYVPYYFSYILSYEAVS